MSCAPIRSPAAYHRRGGEGFALPRAAARGHPYQSPCLGWERVWPLRRTHRTLRDVCATRGVYSEKKWLEKLNYMHNNPVKRGLLASPDQWPWSSFRFYYLNDSSVLSREQLA